MWNGHGCANSSVHALLMKAKSGSSWQPQGVGSCAPTLHKLTALHDVRIPKAYTSGAHGATARLHHPLYTLHSAMSLTYGWTREHLVAIALRESRPRDTKKKSARLSTPSTLTAELGIKVGSPANSSDAFCPMAGPSVQ